MAEEDASVEEARSANRAAAKIQASYRGYRVRKRLQEERNLAKQEVQKESLQEQRNRMEETPNSIEDKSATKIQAGVRGFLVRKRQQNENKAATRIQAGFRGFRTRKLLKQNGQ